MRIIRSLVEMAIEPYCAMYGHDWYRLRKGGLYCKRCGKKSE